jgi:secreted PhoX family phosphatase
MTEATRWRATAAKGAATFDRTESIWKADGRVYFDCTTGGEAQLGQVWEYRPRGRHGGEQYVRGITRRGEIYDFARGVPSSSGFCGGCFSPDGRTFFVNRQGERLATGETPETRAPERAG